MYTYIFKYLKTPTAYINKNKFGKKKSRKNHVSLETNYRGYMYFLFANKRILWCNCPLFVNCFMLISQCFDKAEMTKKI